MKDLRDLKDFDDTRYKTAAKNEEESDDDDGGEACHGRPSTQLLPIISNIGADDMQARFPHSHG